MKIRNDQMRALMEAELQRDKTQKVSEEFTGILTRELEAKNAQANSAPSDFAPLAPGAGINLNQLYTESRIEAQNPLAASAPLSNIQPPSEEAAAYMEGMFSTLEDYAQQLARNDKADLREAYALLENVNSQLGQFKTRFPGMREEDPAMAAMINELDVLTATETFKFNRGDYL